MKKSNLFVILSVVLLTMVSCKIPKEFIEGVVVNPSPVEYHNGEVIFNMEGTFPEKYFAKNIKIRVTPVITSSNGEVFRADSKTFQGEKIKGNNEEVLYKIGGKYSQKAVFDYKVGMDSSIISVEAEVITNKGKVIALPPVELAKGVVITPLLVSSKTNTGDLCNLVAKDKFQRIIEEKTDAQINFLINRSDIRYSERKKDELVELTKTIKAAKEDEKREFVGIEINSYASPDGELEFNEKLSDRRSNVAEKYINREIKKLKAEISIDSKFTAEDWAGFQELVEKSDISDKAVILRVLSMYTDSEQREKEIKNLSVAYKAIADDILPELRRSKMSLKVNVIGKSDEEISELVKTDIKQLNLEEILYAATLVEGDEEKINIYLSASELFPADYRSYNNIGNIYLNQGKKHDASRFLLKAYEINPNDPIVNFNCGLMKLSYLNLEDAKVFFGNAGGVGEPLNAALGTIEIIEGNYKKAVSLLSKTVSNNAALANVLNKNYQEANNILNKVEEPIATTYYLKAIVAARTNDVENLVSNLKIAIEKDAKYKEKAPRDMEFINYFENELFIEAIK